MFKEVLGYKLDQLKIDAALVSSVECFLSMKIKWRDQRSFPSPLPKQLDALSSEGKWPERKNECPGKRIYFARQINNLTSLIRDISYDSD